MISGRIEKVLSLWGVRGGNIEILILNFYLIPESNAFTIESKILEWKGKV